MTPFLKWAGGKRRLLPVILDRLPPQFDGAAGFTYLDPFTGGGQRALCDFGAPPRLPRHRL